ncbi:hypothetical protein B0H10DRAFT_1776278 [Mycena sp. CBHHK59/15]|nr:hypothetical protein B0H10DRAFT_1776278 [Mycena sp. CBHHK59/15]
MPVPPGIVCDLDEYTRSLTDPSIFCLTRGDSIGLTITSEAGVISVLAFSSCSPSSLYRNAIRHIRRTGKCYIVQEPMDVLMLSLFVADLIQAIGAVMDARWVHAGKVEVGAFCTAQGVVQQLGETSVAITTLMITVFTFVGVWWRKGLGATFLAEILVGLAWLFVVLIVAIGNALHRSTHDLYESPTPYWCWIGQGYLGLRIWGEYVWFWITLGFSSFAYLLLFLWARGNITVSETSWWRFSVHRTSSTEVDRGQRRNSYTMIAYPVCYCILVLPLSVVRWIGFVQDRGGRTGHTPPPATFAVISIYGLSGALNVALLLNTRPNSILFGDGSGLTPAAGRAPSPVNFERQQGREDNLQLGRLPSASDHENAWDLPRAKGVVHRHHDDDSTVNVSV